MRTNEAGRLLIQEFEGLRLKAYQCSADRWTIGWGHTKGVKWGNTCSVEQALEWFDEDLKDAEAALQNVTVPLNENEFAALISFIFNFGETKFKTSTLLRKLNAKDYTGAALEFKKWNRSAGKVEEGLIRRRRAEALLFTKRVEVEDAA